MIAKWCHEISYVKHICIYVKLYVVVSLKVRSTEDEKVSVALYNNCSVLPDFSRAPPLWLFSQAITLAVELDINSRSVLLVRVSIVFGGIVVLPTTLGGALA